MARGSTPRKPPAAKPSGSPGPDDSRDRIIDALMALLATRDFGEIGLADVAREAGVLAGDVARCL